MASEAIRIQSCYNPRLWLPFVDHQLNNDAGAENRAEADCPSQPGIGAKSFGKSVSTIFRASIITMNLP